MLADVLQEWGGSEVDALDVYSKMFRFGEGYIQKEHEPGGCFKANPIAYWRNDGEDHGHYRIVFEDKFKEILPELQKADFCIINGLSYFGRRNLQKHASKMFAMIFDLDGVTDKTLNAFLSGAMIADAYPVPNYIILSGFGVHLYYLFEEPIPLFPNIKLQLKEFKYALADRMWNAYTSTFKTKQKQGINQGFRIIGGPAKKGAPEQRVRAFQIHDHPFSLTLLGRYVPEAMQVDESKLFRESKVTLQEAKKKYPEWYERVVVGNDKSRKRWKIEEKVHGDNPYALYDWWKGKVREGAAYTHRYFCMMCLVIYGVKCNVPYEIVKKDVYDFIPFLTAINPDEPFTKSDADSALECYDLRYCTFPIKDISVLSDIKIEKNRRNGRNQKDHIQYMNHTKNFKLNFGECTAGGRPKGSGTKEQIVADYIENNPGMSVSEIARNLSISRTTVYKYKKVLQERIHVDEQVETETEAEANPYDQMRKTHLMNYITNFKL